MWMKEEYSPWGRMGMGIWNTLENGARNDKSIPCSFHTPLTTSLINLNRLSCNYWLRYEIV
jgi:hypothetical protein